VALVRGCLSTGTARGLENMIIPFYMLLERLCMKYHSQSRATQPERCGKAGPSSVEGHQGGWQLEDMTDEERELESLCLQERKSRGKITAFCCLRRSYREGKPNPSQRHKVKYDNNLHPGKFGLDIKKVFLYSKSVKVLEPRKFVETPPLGILKA